jgi:hypothetical protein
MSIANIQRECADVHNKLDNIIAELNAIKRIDRDEIAAIKKDIKRLSDHINVIDLLATKFVPNIYIYNVTPDILGIIAKHLSLTDILSFSQTCKHVRQNLGEIMKEVHRHLGIKGLEPRLRRGFVLNDTIKVNTKALTPFLPLMNYKMIGSRYKDTKESRAFHQNFTRVLIHKKFAGEMLYPLPNVTHLMIVRGNICDKYLMHSPKMQLSEPELDDCYQHFHTKLFVDTPYIDMFPEAVNVILQHVYIKSLEFMTKLEELTLIESLVGTFDSNIPACPENKLSGDGSHRDIPGCFIRITNCETNKHFRSLKHLKIKTKYGIDIAIDMNIFPSLISLCIYTTGKVDIQNIQTCKSLKQLYVKNIHAVDTIQLLNAAANVDHVSLNMGLYDTSFDTIRQIRCKSMNLIIRGCISIPSLIKLSNVNKIQFIMRESGDPTDRLLKEDMSTDYLNALYPDGCEWRCVSVRDIVSEPANEYFIKSSMMKNVEYLKLDPIKWDYNILKALPNLIGLSIFFHSGSYNELYPEQNIKYLELENTKCLKGYHWMKHIECLCIRDEYLSPLLKSYDRNDKKERMMLYDFASLRILLINGKKTKAFETFLNSLSADIANGHIPLKYLYITRYDPAWPVIQHLKYNQNVLINYPISPLPHLFSLYKDNPPGIGISAYRFDIFDPINDRDSISAIDCVTRDYLYN